MADMAGVKLGQGRRGVVGCHGLYLAGVAPLQLPRHECLLPPLHESFIHHYTNAFYHHYTNAFITTRIILPSLHECLRPSLHKSFHLNYDPRLPLLLR